jgi:hypothetical protein
VRLTHTHTVQTKARTKPVQGGNLEETYRARGNLTAQSRGSLGKIRRGSLKRADRTKEVASCDPHPTPFYFLIYYYVLPIQRRRKPNKIIKPL